MSRNKLVSELFEQEFNKEGNYKQIMKRIEESKKPKQKRPIWKPALAVLGVVVIVVAAFLLVPKGNNKLEDNPQSTDSSTESINGLYINELGSIDLIGIDTPWRSTIAKNPDITDSEFSIVDEINQKSLNGKKGLIFGGYEDDMLVEYVVSYTNEENQLITLDVTKKDFEPKYLKYSYEQDVIANELAKAKESSIDGKSVKILHFDNKYYINFIKNDLVFDIEFENFSKDDLGKLINDILR